jgi:hypothetical protein
MTARADVAEPSVPPAVDDPSIPVDALGSPLEPPEPVASVLPAPVDPVEPVEPDATVEPASAPPLVPVASPEPGAVAPSGDLVDALDVSVVRAATTSNTGAVLSASKTSDFDLG